MTAGLKRARARSHPGCVGQFVHLVDGFGQSAPLLLLEGPPRGLADVVEEARGCTEWEQIQRTGLNFAVQPLARLTLWCIMGFPG